MWDSCSWRRIGTTEPYADGNVICPIVQRDGHPDLLAKREDLDFIATCNPAAVSALIAEVERLADENAELKAVVVAVGASVTLEQAREALRRVAHRKGRE